jgi:hypothetical protein
MSFGCSYESCPCSFAQDHDVVFAHGKAVAGKCRGSCFQRRNVDHRVSCRDVVTGRVAWDRTTCAYVIVQQFDAWCRHVRCDMSNADVGVVEVVEVGLFGPVVNSDRPDAQPEHGPEESRGSSYVADCESRVIDAEKRADIVGSTPFVRYTIVGECEEFKRVAVMISELKRSHTARAIR